MAGSRGGEAGSKSHLAGAAFPILEFDPTAEALIEPTRLARPIDGLPERAVVCFFQEVIEAECIRGGAAVVGRLHWEHGVHPLYDLDVGAGRHVAVFHPGVGAPLAAGLLEEVIAHGCRAFVACGGAGALVPDLALGHVVVPTAAVRDEGTSYHYVAPSREIAADPGAVSVARSVLERKGIPHTLGKTWTTDAPFRETAARVARRREEGCITVEMEAAAFMAVAQHRRVRFAQYLYAGDDVSGEAWDHRSWQTSSARRELFHLAVETVLEL
jgi:uridine phosphorylase